MNNFIIGLMATTFLILNFTGPEAPAKAVPVPKPKPAGPAVILSDQERSDLYRTLLGEAAHQGEDEIMAITGLILNRLHTGRYGASLSAVVKAKRCRMRTVQGIEWLPYEDFTWQFTAWDKWHYDARAMHGRLTPSERKAMARIKPIADRAVALWQPLPCPFVNYWHPAAMQGSDTPPWARGKPFTQIGDARFLSSCARKAKKKTTPQAPARIASGS
jgi:hypothetical protein